MRLMLDIINQPAQWSATAKCRAVCCSLLSLTTKDSLLTDGPLALRHFGEQPFAYHVLFPLDTETTMLLSCLKA